MPYKCMTLPIYLQVSNQNPCAKEFQNGPLGVVPRDSGLCVVVLLLTGRISHFLIGTKNQKKGSTHTHTHTPRVIIGIHKSSSSSSSHRLALFHIAFFRLIIRFSRRSVPISLFQHSILLLKHDRRPIFSVSRTLSSLARCFRLQISADMRRHTLR